MDLGGPGPRAEVARSARCPRAPGWSRSRTRACRADGTTRPSSPRSRETLRLAFVAALQHLPPRQRAVLILREVLRWQATEVAELLDTTVASVNSALQRARATIADRDVTADDARPEPLDDEQRELLDRYVEAFEEYDMDALAALLHEDATLSMPPFELWLQGAGEIRQWMLGPRASAAGLAAASRSTANGSPGFAQYRPSAGGGHEPWALQVLEISDGRIAGINSFLDTERALPAVRPAGPARRVGRRPARRARAARAARARDGAAAPDPRAAAR